MVPDVRVVPTRWAEPDDGVLIEWVNTGTLNGAPFALRGADRYTIRDGRASEGVAYFDPRPSSKSRRRRPTSEDGYQMRDPNELANRYVALWNEPDPDRLADVVTFNWEIVSKDGDVAGGGLEFLVLAPDGRIRRDYQFIES
jgi:hypothetical protein